MGIHIKVSIAVQRCFPLLPPRPVAPELQLLAVLPAQSAPLLPEVLRPLVEDGAVWGSLGGKCAMVPMIHGETKDFHELTKLYGTFSNHGREFTSMGNGN